MVFAVEVAVAGLERRGRELRRVLLELRMSDCEHVDPQASILSRCSRFKFQPMHISAHSCPTALAPLSKN